jgi:hypothetical protein
MFKQFEVDGVRLAVTRRRYGKQTFTWLLYVNNDHRFDSYGDPWPSVVIPKKQLAAAVAEIKIRLAGRSVAA